MSATAGTHLTLETSLEQYPGISSFALDFTRRTGSALRFLRPMELTEIWPNRSSRDATLVAGLARSNQAWGNDVTALLERWARGDSVTLIAGQQVGFGGGPLYTLIKLVSLLRLRDHLARRGVQATVFFWLATEDHDFLEVSRLTVATREGLCLLDAENRSRATRPVGPLPVPDELRRQMMALLGDPEASWLQPGITFADSFARLIVSILGSGSVILVDSLLPELRRAGAGLFQELHSRGAEMEELIRKQSARIEKAGYRPQVLPGGDGEYSFLYEIRDGERKPIARNGPLKVEPEKISTGVLARPLLQDAVLAPDVFVGGPAEVSYYAQISGIHEKLGIAIPQVALRGHALVAPSRFLKAAEKYGLRPEELLLPVEEAIARHETNAVARLEELIAAADRRIEEQLEDLRSLITGYDGTAARPIDHSLRKIRHQLRRTGERGRRAIARHDADRFQSITRLHEILLPNGQPQDRVVGWISYWMQYGEQLVARLLDEIEPATDRLKIVGL